MQKKDPLHEDPSSQWPEEIKKAYEHIEVPSLYDFILANERLSLELRRQGKDVKLATEELQVISSKINSILKILDEDLEIYEVEDDDEEENLKDLERQFLDEEAKEDQSYLKEFLIDTVDSLVELSQKTRQLTNQLMNLLPKQNVSSSDSDWLNVPKDITQSIVENVDDVRYKIRIKLEDWGIEVIEPQLGESFTSQKHRVLNYIEGGQSHTIARVIRVGYQQREHVLRLADVIVYS